jgi:hypothetical protein
MVQHLMRVKLLCFLHSLRNHLLLPATRLPIWIYWLTTNYLFLPSNLRVHRHQCSSDYLLGCFALLASSLGNTETNCKEYIQA